MRKINVEHLAKKLELAFASFDDFECCATLAKVADISWCEADAGLAHLQQLGLVERWRNTNTGQWRYKWRAS